MEGMHVPMEGMCPWRICAHGGYVPTEGMCPWRVCAHGGYVTCSTVVPSELASIIITREAVFL